MLLIFKHAKSQISDTQTVEQKIDSIQSVSKALSVGAATCDVAKCRQSILIQLYGFCAGDKRMNELSEAFHLQYSEVIANPILQ